MKKILLSIAFMITVFTVSSQDVTGDWNGILKVQGMSLRLVFHIFPIQNGYKATMDSPDQGANGIPMTTVTFNDNVLTLELSSASLKYTSESISSDSITGTFSQMGQKFPLNLYRKVVAQVKPKRPQEPALPYPYISEDVTFLNKKENFKLAGTLTLPKGTGKFPAVILISGSGPQNRDEEIMGHKPFLVLADYLTRNGIAVLRYDDRGTNKSEGNFQTATTPDLATDVASAVQYLKTRIEINPLKIGLIGHSEGGIIAPMVAAEDKNLKFIVLLAGSGIPGSEILLLQQELIGRANGMKDEDIKKTAELNSTIYKMIDEIESTDTLKIKIKDYLMAKTKELPEMKIPEGSNPNDMIDMQINQITSPWMLYFIRYNPAPMLNKVKCPVLAVIGSNDLQVPSKVNLQAIEKALKKGGNKNFTVKEMPGLNHLFQESKTGSPNEYAQIEQTISPVLLETVTKWIKSL